MSHFHAIVICPSDEATEAAVDRLLAPFDESEQVEEYEAECYCVGSNARYKVNEELIKQFGSIDERRKKFEDQFGARERKEKQKIWEEHFYNPYEMARKTLMKSASGFDDPDPDCEECNGDGKRMTRYNPVAQWDWWVIGGRWDGVIKGNPRSSQGGFNFGDDHHTLGNNSILVRDLVDAIQTEKDRIPYAIVTPDGEWVSRGEMGWFGISSNEESDDDWRKKAEEIFRQYMDYTAVGCDLHI